MKFDIGPERYGALAPELGHFAENAQRVDLPGHESRQRERPSVCETQAAMLGSFATSRGLVSEVMIFNGPFKRFDLNQEAVLAQIDIGLERLNKFADGHMGAFEHTAKSAEEIIWDNMSDDETTFVAGVQVMFDTEYGGLRPELVYNMKNIDSVVFAPQSSLLSLYANGIDVDYTRLHANDRAASVINPTDQTRSQLAITAASLVLPKSLDYVI